MKLLTRGAPHYAQGLFKEVVDELSKYSGDGIDMLKELAANETDMEAREPPTA